jgi:hypothetical protein
LSSLSSFEHPDDGIFVDDINVIVADLVSVDARRIDDALPRSDFERQALVAHAMRTADGDYFTAKRISRVRCR